MLHHIIDRNLLVYSILASAYIGFLHLNYHILHWGFVLFGVIRELITIPIMISLLLLLYLLLYRVVKARFKVNPIQVITFFALVAGIYASWFNW